MSGSSDYIAGVLLVITSVATRHIGGDSTPLVREMKEAQRPEGQAE